MHDDLQFLASEGSAALRGRDKHWFGIQRHESLEAIVSAVVGLFGVLVLDWPAAGMMLFLVAALWVGLLTDLARYAMFPARLRSALHHLEKEERLWTLVRARRQGLPDPRAARPLPGGPGLQLLFAFWVAVAFTGALVHEIHAMSGSDLLLEAARRPDMLAAMGLLLLTQLVQAVLVLRGKGDGAHGIVSFTPFFDVLMFVILLFFWMIISGIVIKLGTVVHGIAPGTAAVTVFVLVGYGLMLWRGVIELRELREARADMDWLREMLEASATTTGQHDL
jgi:hypothetical protein